MTFDQPLTPRLEQFVCEQLAAGRFQSKNDVIIAALSVLEEQSLCAHASKVWRKRDTDTGLAGNRSQPASKQFWQGLRETLHGDSVPPKEATAIPAARRSPRGILADLPSHLDPDDIRQARREMWTGFPLGEAG